MLSTMEPISLDFCTCNTNDRQYSSPSITLKYRGRVIAGKFSALESKLRFESATKNIMSCQLSVNENSAIRKIVDGDKLHCAAGSFYVCHAEMRYDKMLVEEAARFAHAPDDLTEYFAREGCEQLTIFCGQNDWKVSSELMRIRSPVFARLLSAELKEAKTKFHVIKGFDPEVVGMMVEWCTTNNITYTQRNAELMFDLVKLANKYDMKHLMRVASVHVAENISLTNFVKTIRLAENHNSELLKKFCDAFHEVVICSSKIQ